MENTCIINILKDRASKLREQRVIYIYKAAIQAEFYHSHNKHLYLNREYTEPKFTSTNYLDHTSFLTLEGQPLYYVNARRK